MEGAERTRAVELIFSMDRHTDLSVTPSFTTEIELVFAAYMKSNVWPPWLILSPKLSVVVDFQGWNVTPSAITTFATEYQASHFKTHDDPFQ